MASKEKPPRPIWVLPEIVDYAITDKKALARIAKEIKATSKDRTAAAQRPLPKKRKN